MVKRFPGQEICCVAGRVSKERGTACCAPLSACQKSPPARSSCGRSRRNQINFVISGGVYVGNDTSHERQSDFIWVPRKPFYGFLGEEEQRRERASGMTRMRAIRNL